MSLPSECVSLLESVETRLHVPAGTTILQEGQVGDCMYLVVDGEISVSLQGSQIDVLRAGDIFGEMALLDAQPRSASVLAISDSILIAVDRDQFAALISAHPDLALQVMNIMSVRLRRSMNEEIQKQKMEQELALGHKIQRSLLPNNNPAMPGWEFASYYQAARQVGGDLYDFIFSAQDPLQLGIVIADVTGKGVPAAIFMAMTRSMMRGEARNGHGPATILANTNDLLLSDSRSPLFLTAAYVHLDTRSGQLCYTNAGHEPLYWLSGASGEVRLLAARGMLLGAFEGAQFAEESHILAPGDALVFCTDGVTEARNAAGEFFDQERTELAVAGASGGSADEILNSLITKVRDFIDQEPQADDLTVVVVRRVA